MSTTNLTTLPTRRRSTVKVAPVTQATVVRSEWIKLRSVRSTLAVLALTFVVGILLGIVVAYIVRTHWTSLSHDWHDPRNLVTRSVLGVILAQLTVGALGVLFVTGEYTSGMMRATLGAVPRRLPVLWAKAGVYGVVALVLSLATAFVGFFASQAIMGSHGVSLGYPGALRAVFGVALYLTVVGLLGVALGFLMRSTAGGITALFTVLLIVPPLVDNLPWSFHKAIEPYLPSDAGQAVYAMQHSAKALHPWPGFLLFCGYTALAFAAAAIALRRRDA
jgi:hypothetical protein